MTDGRILILGKDGQVGRHLVRRLPQAVAWGREELDLTNTQDIRPQIEALAPTCIINAAAYTAVDRAETEPDLAIQINGTAVGEIAAAAEAIDASLLHYSTDYVFDGTKMEPYLPTDPIAPINAYGRSKALGEAAVREGCSRHWILRTSWVFSEYPPNFVATMLRLGKERNELKIVNDQVGMPTYAGELARIAEAIATGSAAVEVGTHHAACPGPVSWHEFATAIFNCAAGFAPGYPQPTVLGIPTEAYPTPAERPANSRLGGGEALGMEDWSTGLAACVPVLIEQL